MVAFLLGRRAPQAGPTCLDAAQQQAREDHREGQEQDRSPPWRFAAGGQQPRHDKNTYAVHGPESREKQHAPHDWIGPETTRAARIAHAHAWPSGPSTLPFRRQPSTKGRVSSSTARGRMRPHRSPWRRRRLGRFNTRTTVFFDWPMIEYRPVPSSKNRSTPAVAQNYGAGREQA